MTSLPWQAVVIVTVVEMLLVELAAAKQSNPLTKLAVTIPPPLTVAVTGFEEAEGENVIDAELVVQPVKVKVGFAVAAIDTVEP